MRYFLALDRYHELAVSLNMHVVNMKSSWNAVCYAAVSRYRLGSKVETGILTEGWALLDCSQ
jgi:hypothetical protein